jgi:hypothetical protein
MPSYDATHFAPPAPVARVILCNPHRGATVSDVPLLVDTGADITLLPRSAVEQLGVPLLAGQRYELMSFDGNRSFAPVVMLDLLWSPASRLHLSRPQKRSRGTWKGRHSARPRDAWQANRKAGPWRGGIEKSEEAKAAR